MPTPLLILDAPPLDAADWDCDLKGRVCPSLSDASSCLPSPPVRLTLDFPTHWQKDMEVRGVKENEEAGRKA